MQMVVFGRRGLGAGELVAPEMSLLFGFSVGRARKHLWVCIMPICIDFWVCMPVHETVSSCCRLHPAHYHRARSLFLLPSKSGSRA